MSEHRTQTKSEVKWLANELAMLAGEIEKVDREVVRLAERRCALVATRDQLSRVAALAEVPASLQLLKPVRAHPHYGGRGNLRDFLRETLREAYPRAIDTHTMAELAVQHFTEAFDSKLSWERFRMRRVAVDDHTIIDTSTLEAAMDEAKLTPKDLALMTGLHQNVIQRVLKYGYAHETVVPKLAEAVGMAHPNAMLPSRKSDGIGMRIEDGASFLKALRKTHMWRRIIGESLAGDEAQEVGRICEALQEYVELADLRIDPANISPPEYAEMAAEPIDEGQLAGYIQELLDELKEMDVAVVVTTGIRYARMSGDLAAMDGTPLHEATLFFERVNALRSPGSTAAAA